MAAQGQGPPRSRVRPARSLGGQLVAKSARLLSEGKVRALAGARTYQVDGDHGAYLVTVADPDSLEVLDGRPGPAGAFCTCPAEGTCSHLAAAVQARIAEIQEHGSTEIPA